jgi:hypothetical protein
LKYPKEFLPHIFHKYRPACVKTYILVLALDMDLFCISTSCTIYAGVMDTRKHEHLIIRFVANAAGLAYFVHRWLYNFMVIFIFG